MKIENKNKILLWFAVVFDILLCTLVLYDIMNPKYILGATYDEKYTIVGIQKDHLVICDNNTETLYYEPIRVVRNRDCRTMLQNEDGTPKKHTEESKSVTTVRTGASPILFKVVSK